MFQEPTPSGSAGRYQKVSNFVGLYRHSTTGRYYGVKKFNGKRYEGSLRTADRKIAERRFKDWAANLAKVDTEVEKTTLRELGVKLLAINQGKSKSSRYIIKSILKEFTDWCGGAMQVRELRSSDIDGWLARHEGKLRNTTLNRYTGVIKQLCELAVRDRIIVESPFLRARTRWKRPQTPARIIPTTDELVAIIEAIRSQRFTRFAHHTADFVEFLSQAGLGQAEASSLTWGAVDMERGCMSIRRHKTDVRFTVPIYPHLRPLLERLKQQAGKASPSTKVFKIRNAKKALAAACRRLGYPPFSQRSLRQHLIMRLWKSGVDKKLIAKWQGHQDGGALILSTYTETFGSDDAAYEVQQLAKLGPVAVPHAPSKPAQPCAKGRSVAPAKLRPHSSNSSVMETNPFKPDEKVLTKVKGADVEATVAQVFNGEVQVKTAVGKLLWRTMHTVWSPGSSPIPKAAKPKAEVAPPVVPQPPVQTDSPQPAEPVTPPPVEASTEQNGVPVEPTTSESNQPQPASETSGVDAPAAPSQPVGVHGQNAKRKSARKRHTKA